MASRRINASWLQYASSRYVSWWVSPSLRIWNATRWRPSSRISSARISATTTWLSLVNAWPDATTDAWLYAAGHAWSHASTYAWPHASSYARTYASTDARSHALSNARNGSWICSSWYDGSSFSDGGTRILPLTGSSYGYFIPRCPWKTYAT